MTGGDLWDVRTIGTGFGISKVDQRQAAEPRAR